MDALSVDIENALQHAIGVANGAFTTGIPQTRVDSEVMQRKKGKKRVREEILEKGEDPKEMKRKKKRHSGSEGGGASGQSNIDPVLLDSPVVEKKKSKKQKHTDVHSSLGLPTPAGEVCTSTIIHDPSSATSPIPSSPLRSTLPSGGDFPVTASLYYPLPPPPFASLNPGDDSIPQLNTNDDILRAFQDLDLTRLAGVLRSLDLPALPQSNTQRTDLSQGDSSKVYLDQDSFPNASSSTNTSVAASAAQTRKARGSTRPSAVAKRLPSVPKPTSKQNSNLPVIGPSIANSEHTEILATRWLNTAKLKELVETQGLVYKKGKFSAIEEQALRAAIENYRVNHGLAPEKITELIFSKSKEANSTFWSEITASVPARPIVAVYHHLRRVYHPLKLQGKWSPDEDSDLIKAVADLGQAWSKISERVGRSEQDCRDRWRNHVAHRSDRQSGRWSTEEEEELTRIVTELTIAQGKDSDNDVFWGIVSQRMGNKRGRQQCRIKWTDALSKTVKNAGQTPRWNKLDVFILVQKVASLDIRDDSEIDWKLLPDPDWNLWSAHALQRRWRSLKSGIKGHDEMAFSEIVEILKQKNPRPARPDEMPSKKPSRKKMARPISSVLIEEDAEGDQMRECEDNEEDGGSEEEPESRNAC